MPYKFRLACQVEPPIPTSQTQLHLPIHTAAGIKRTTRTNNFVKNNIFRTWCDSIASRSCCRNGKTGKLSLHSSIFARFFSNSVMCFIFPDFSFTREDFRSESDSLPDSAFSSFSVPGILRACFKKIKCNNKKTCNRAKNLGFNICESFVYEKWQ